MKDFFISYNRHDKQWAEWIAWTLEEAGYTVVIQAWDFRPGGNFVLDMQRASVECEKTIAVLSAHYLQSEYTHSEWSTAFAGDPQSLKRKLIPMRVGECRPEGVLKTIVYVDLVGVTEAEAHDLVLSALKERAKPAQKPGFPGVETPKAERTEPEPVAFPVATAPEAATPVLQRFEFDVITVNTEGQETSRKRGQAAYFTEDLGGGVVLELVSIPGGTFLMGSPEGEGSDDEKPQHSVTVPPFCMGKHPVTQAQWQAVAALPKLKCDLDSDPAEFKGAQRPVERVSWDEAVEFCDRLSRKTGKEYRLPSEAEWEYACRAGTTTPFYFGETLTTDLANYNGNYIYGAGPKGKYRGQTTDVGSFPPNAFGLYDLHGNVWEWCEDDRHSDYSGAPTDGSAWVDRDRTETRRVLRGGSWYHFPRNCRSACRNYFPRDSRYFNIGFRVCCVPP